MRNATLYVLQNTHDQKFISNDKVALWAQTSDLQKAHFFPAEHNANVNAKRLNGYVAKYRKQAAAKAAGELITSYAETAYLNDNFVVVPVTVTL